MKFTKICTALGLASLLVSATFGAAYIKIEGVDGESKDERHKGWIDVISVSGIATPREAASGLATGKRQHAPITITKRIDKSSPLFKANGNQSANPIFESRMTLEDGGTTYALEGVKVIASQRNGDTETITLSYTSLKAMPQATQSVEIKAKAAKATDYNSSRSNKNSSR